MDKDKDKKTSVTIQDRDTHRDHQQPGHLARQPAPITPVDGYTRDRRALATNTVSRETDAPDALRGSTAHDLSIVRQYTCGCAVVLYRKREIDQPALTCDRGDGHAQELTYGWEQQRRLF